MADTPEIVFIKKKSAHGAHHGGAWKVAYADFVTGMMALFIVLWLMNSSPSIQVAVSGYFKDPQGSSKTAGTNKIGNTDKVRSNKEDMRRLKEEILMSIQRLDPLDKLKHQIEITITSEGLRIELMESAKGTFFKLGSALPTPALKELLNVLAPELGKLPNKISIEGHTDSTPYVGSKNYDNWDLSTDRANEARRLMQQEGVREDQVSQVRGFADQHLRLPLKPRDPSNRRISLIVQYQVIDGSEKPVSTTITQSKAVQPTP